MHQAWNILISARAFHDSGVAAQVELANRHCVLQYSDIWGPLAEDNLIRQLQTCDAVIAATDPYSKAIFEAAPRLKLIARCGVGIDSVRLEEATHAGIMVTNVPDAMTDAVADYCMALILSSVRRICEGAQCMREGGWTELPGFELAGKTLGLIGFGRIGQAVAKRAISFGMKIVAFDPYVATSSQRESFPQVQFLELDEVFRVSRIVSIHAPNQADTLHLVNAQRLAMMSSDALLINTSRGKLIDETALIEALEKESIAGAAIDVYQQEPLPREHPLRKTRRLLLTPHNAFNSVEAAMRMSDGCAEPIIDLLEGRIPKCLCNPDVLNSPNLRISK